MSHFQKHLDKFIALATTVCLIAIVGDGAVNALYILDSRTVDGTSLSDYLLTAGFFILWVGLVRALTMLGIEVLPYSPMEKRKKVLPLWFAGMALTACISIYMSSSFLALGIAEKEYFSSTTQNINAKAASTIEAQRTANSLQVVFQSSEASAKVLHEMEKKQGSVCEQGSGTGRCATTLLNIIEISSSSRQQLIEQNGLADPIITRIQELQDGMRRIASNPDLDYQSKATKLQENITLMAGEIEALSKTLPIATLLHASDSFSRNWSSMGLGDVGSRRLTAEFRPVADRLKREIGALKAASEIEITGIREMSAYELLSRSQEALPIIAIATLLACLPMLLSVCILGISGGSEPPQSGSGNPPNRKAEPAMAEDSSFEEVAILHAASPTKH